MNKLLTKAHSILSPRVFAAALVIKEDQLASYLHGVIEFQLESQIRNVVEQSLSVLNVDINLIESRDDAEYGRFITDDLDIDWVKVRAHVLYITEYMTNTDCDGFC